MSCPARWPANLPMTPPATGPAATGASSGGVVFSHKLSVTAFGMERITRFG